MNIDVNAKIAAKKSQNITTTKTKQEDSITFSSELSNLEKQDVKDSKVQQKNEVEKAEKSQNAEDIDNKQADVEPQVMESQESNTQEKNNHEHNNQENKVQNSPQIMPEFYEKSEDENQVEMSQKEMSCSDNIQKIMGGLTDAVLEINYKLNQTEEKKYTDIKNSEQITDNIMKDEVETPMDNNMNIQDVKDSPVFQMNASMNFNSGSQSFSDVMENSKDNNKLSSSAKDLAEEKLVLSTMDENISIANRNRIMADKRTEEVELKQNVKTVISDEGIKKVDKKTNITVENVVKFDNVIMDEKDVDFFVKLVENGRLEVSNGFEKSAVVSKTLADLIAKSMKDNQPVRIDFDNDISVIIKISRNGKISADFLPSSQIAEAYLKENLPLLRQKFEDNNIDYDELNHRQRKQDDDKNNKKKEHKNE